MYLHHTLLLLPLIALVSATVLADGQANAGPDFFGSDLKRTLPRGVVGMVLKDVTAGELLTMRSMNRRLHTIVTDEMIERKLQKQARRIMSILKNNFYRNGKTFKYAEFMSVTNTIYDNVGHRCGLVPLPPLMQFEIWNLQDVLESAMKEDVFPASLCAFRLHPSNMFFFINFLSREARGNVNVLNFLKQTKKPTEPPLAMVTDSQKPLAQFDLHAFFGNAGDTMLPDYWRWGQGEPMFYFHALCYLLWNKAGERREIVDQRIRDIFSMPVFSSAFNADPNFNGWRIWGENDFDVFKAVRGGQEVWRRNMRPVPSVAFLTDNFTYAIDLLDAAKMLAITNEELQLIPLFGLKQWDTAVTLFRMILDNKPERPVRVTKAGIRHLLNFLEVKFTSGELTIPKKSEPVGGMITALRKYSTYFPNGADKREPSKEEYEKVHKMLVGMLTYLRVDEIKVHTSK